MDGGGVYQEATSLLDECNRGGGFDYSLVCTDTGLVIASAGQTEQEDDTAAFASLFDDILARARRDLGFATVDEVTLLDPQRGRTVIRPLLLGESTVVFVVVRAPVQRTWRRFTNILCRRLTVLLQPLAEV